MTVKDYEEAAERAERESIECEKAARDATGELRAALYTERDVWSDRAADYRMAADRLANGTIEEYIDAGLRADRW